jgi:electron transfer flavoprotein beta subunit
MKILVLLKRVPDTASRIVPAGDGAAIDTSGIEWIVSPYDEIAVERAIQFAEADGSSVTVMCLGPKEATKVIRTTLAMGADDGILLVDEAPWRDASSTAKALASAIRDGGYDLVLAGWKAADTDDSSVPHYVAAQLGIPCVTLAVKLDAADGRAVVHREVEGAEEVVEVPLPCIVTVQKGLVEPRYTSLKGIMKAKKKPIDERPAPAADPGIRVLSLTPPESRKAGRILGEGTDAVPELVRVLSEEQKLF